MIFTFKLGSTFELGSIAANVVFGNESSSSFWSIALQPEPWAANCDDRCMGQAPMQHMSSFYKPTRPIKALS